MISILSNLLRQKGPMKELKAADELPFRWVFFSAMSPPVTHAKIPCFIGASVLFSPGQKRRLFKLLLQMRKCIAQWAYWSFPMYTEYYTECSFTTATKRKVPSSSLHTSFLQPHTPNPFLSSNLSSYYSLSSYLLPHDRGSDLSAMNETLNQQLKWHILMNPYIALNASPTLLLSTWYVSYDKKYIKYIVFPIPALLLETLSNSVS